MTIFCDKIGVFLKNQCYDQIFAKTSCSLSKKTPIFSLNFSAKIILNIITSVPDYPDSERGEPTLITLKVGDTVTVEIS
jgi:hypothetical protein